MVSVTQKYFNVSGMGTRSSLASLKKWSMAWRDVNTMAV